MGLAMLLVLLLYSQQMEMDSNRLPLLRLDTHYLYLIHVNLNIYLILMEKSGHDVGRVGLFFSFLLLCSQEIWLQNKRG